MNQRFQEAKEEIMKSERLRKSIGTLSEKTLHAILKEYYAPSKEAQEVRLDGYVADIFTGDEVIEIQTAQFHRMREKLSAFLPKYPVTIVYPVPREKWLFWVDEESGEISEPRKSPKKGTIYEIFRELYQIKGYLREENLRIRIALIDMEEFKLLNGWGKNRKNNASRYDRIPIELVQEVEMCEPRDYMLFVPESLEGEFTVFEFSKAAHIPKKQGTLVLNILHHTGVIRRIGKKGQAYLYEIREDERKILSE